MLPAVATVGFTPTGTPRPLPTFTPTPARPFLGVSTHCAVDLCTFTADQKLNITNGLERLKRCAPASYQLVNAYTREIQPSTGMGSSPSLRGDVIYLSVDDLWKPPLSETARETTIVATIAHQAYRNRQITDDYAGWFNIPLQEEQRRAYASELPLLDACTLPQDRAALADYRARVEKYASSFSSEPTIAPVPADILVDPSLTSEEQRMIADGIAHLRQCAPNLYDYVRANIREVKRGTENRPNAIFYTYPGKPTVFLPKTSMVGYPERAIDSIRTFMVAESLVHEARHLALGINSTEPDAYRFALQVFTPQCIPNDIEPGELDPRRRYLEWRASLSYSGDPPPDEIPPEFQ